jgi:hypothetical protein
MDRESDDRSGDDAVGYRRPPKRTQWQKGQCGNPTRKRKSVPRGAAEIIDQLFAKRFKVTENGSPRTASSLEVIITRLISKEIAGDRRAMAVRLKYLAFAHLVSGHRLDRRRRDRIGQFDQCSVWSSSGRGG